MANWPWECHFLAERSLLPHKCHIYSNFLFWFVPFSLPDTQLPLFTDFVFPCANPPSLKAFLLWLEFLSTDLYMSLTYSLLHLLRRARPQKNIRGKAYAAPPSHRPEINMAVKNAHTHTHTAANKGLNYLYKCFCAKIAILFCRILLLMWDPNYPSEFRLKVPFSTKTTPPILYYQTKMILWTLTIFYMCPGDSTQHTTSLLTISLHQSQHIISLLLFQ